MLFPLVGQSPRFDAIRVPVPAYNEPSRLPGGRARNATSRAKKAGQRVGGIARALIVRPEDVHIHAGVKDAWRPGRTGIVGDVGRAAMSGLSRKSGGSGPRYSARRSSRGHVVGERARRDRTTVESLAARAPASAEFCASLRLGQKNAVINGKARKASRATRMIATKISTAPRSLLDDWSGSSDSSSRSLDRKYLAPGWDAPVDGPPPLPQAAAPKSVAGGRNLPGMRRQRRHFVRIQRTHQTRRDQHHQLGLLLRVRPCS